MGVTDSALRSLNKWAPTHLDPQLEALVATPTAPLDPPLTLDIMALLENLILLVWCGGPYLVVGHSLLVPVILDLE